MHVFVKSDFTPRRTIRIPLEEPQTKVEDSTPLQGDDVPIMDSAPSHSATDDVRDEGKHSSTLQERGFTPASGMTSTNALHRAFDDVPTLLNLRLDSLTALDTIRELPPINDPQRVQEMSKNKMQFLALLNHFCETNATTLGLAVTQELQMFAAAVGLTSSGKDVTTAQLLGKPQVAITGRDMCTSAHVSLTAINAPRDGNSQTDDHYHCSFEGKTVYSGHDVKEYRNKMQELNQRLRNSTEDGFGFSQNHAVVKLTSGTPIFPTFVLNTIGLQPNNGRDAIFEDVEHALNERSEGGILVICHDLTRPLDKTCTYQDLTVVQRFKDNPRNSKWKVMLAVTKGDLLKMDRNILDQCATIESLYMRVFGIFKRRLGDHVEMFLISGWNADDPANEEKCATDLRDAIDDTLQRICNNDAKQIRSPYHDLLIKHVGTDKFIARYQEIMGEQSTRFAIPMVQCITRGRDRLHNMLRTLAGRKRDAETRSLGAPINEMMMMVEKLAGQLRLNDPERSNTASAKVTLLEQEKQRFRTTIDDEYEKLCYKYGDELGLGSDTISNVSPHGMNRASHSALWARLERLEFHKAFFATRFEIPPLSLEDIQDWVKAAPARNVHDTENYVMIKVMEHVRVVWTTQLGPFLAHWIAQLVYESYVMAANVAIELPQVQPLKDAMAFRTLFDQLLSKLFFDDVDQALVHLAIEKPSLFQERVDVESAKRREAHALHVAVQHGLKFLDQLSPENRSWGEGFFAKIKNWTFRSSAPPSELERSQEDSKSNPNESFRMELDSNPYESFWKELDSNPNESFRPTGYLHLKENEVEKLNFFGHCVFYEKLAVVIDKFFYEAKAFLDPFYSNTIFADQAKVLLKHLFFATVDSAKEQDPPHADLEQLRTNLARVSTYRRFQGYDVGRLQRTGLLAFTNDVGQLRDAVDVKQDDDDSDPFTNIVPAAVQNQPDLTEGLPRRLVPGYNSCLSDEVQLIAVQFMAKFYDERTTEVHDIVEEAKRVRRKCLELNDTLNVMEDAWSRAGYTLPFPKSAN
jgi:hypothetical protein